MLGNELLQLDAFLDHCYDSSSEEASGVFVSFLVAHFLHRSGKAPC